MLCSLDWRVLCWKLWDNMKTTLGQFQASHVALTWLEGTWSSPRTGRCLWLAASWPPSGCPSSGPPKTLTYFIWCSHHLHLWKHRPHFQSDKIGCLWPPPGWRNRTPLACCHLLMRLRLRFFFCKNWTKTIPESKFTSSTFATSQLLWPSPHSTR